MTTKTFTPTIKLEHADARGEIYSIQLPDDRELMLLHSVPGVFRGGHSHDCKEVVVVLSGEMRYHKREKPGEEPGETRALYAGGMVAVNVAGQVHMGEFLRDTWLLEYKQAKKGDWKQTDYEPFRQKVRESISV